MKLYLMFLVFLLSILQSYDAEGIRMGKVLTLSASSNQDILKISSIKRSNNDHELIAKTDEDKSGLNRKLMTKTESSTTTYVSKNHKNEENRNDPKLEIKSAHGPIAYKDNFMVNSLPENFQHEKDVSNEPNPSDIDIVDYTPARNKSPIHN
ncbi:putative Root meristem growth factor 9 [Helianthus annuus]|uniref:Root meristem growth factor 9 n=1 Tax=Helianthus annuus TaxID=4232 RepID=A0A251SYQ3_HELAN|nr:uncharacterized protein LOC110893910 [Helianthus annuus]KAF5776471.1 putative Root meristem growth factor 9 [Helianthus annuus]KAJ0503984.1 putative protein GOLVEN 2 [Helianthus annuus]KAJ0677042.1 putative protein GOLVEN 2 [Helianthus annuus]KAJ0861330.1 putative Root meristem growth factor 9 [Helianthus annuus]